MQISETTQALLNVIAVEDNLQLMYAAAWAMLIEGAKTYTHPMHQFSLVTVDGNLPAARTVVLRKTNQPELSINIHTDVRSPKVQQLKNNPNAVALFYAHEQRMQIKLTTTATIQTNNDVTKQAWSKARLSSKLVYSKSVASSNVIDTPEQLYLNQGNVEQALLQFCEDNFCIITLHISSMEIILLNSKYNKRMQALYSNSDVQLNWLQV